MADLDSSNRLTFCAGDWAYSRTTCQHVKEFCWYLSDSGRIPNLMQIIDEIQGKEKIKSFSALVRRVCWIDKDGKYEVKGLMREERKREERGRNVPFCFKRQAS